MTYVLVYDCAAGHHHTECMSAVKALAAWSTALAYPEDYFNVELLKLTPTGVTVIKERTP